MTETIFKDAVSAPHQGFTSVLALFYSNVALYTANWSCSRNRLDWQMSNTTAAS